MSKPTPSPEPEELFTALLRESTLSSRVARQLEAMITASRLQSGDHLPPERELARQFGVSRTVVREAVSALAARSLLEVVPGNGTVICAPSAQSVTQAMTLFLRAGQPQPDYAQVNEVRRVLEVEIAGLAAEQRTEDDLRRMEATLREVAASARTRDDFTRVDIAFHSALAQATQNELYGLLLDSVADIMAQVRHLGFAVPGAAERTMKHHRAIFEQVQRGDWEGARQAMRDHLAEAEDTQRRAMRAGH